MINNTCAKKIGKLEEAILSGNKQIDELLGIAVSISAILGFPPPPLSGGGSGGAPKPSKIIDDRVVILSTMLAKLRNLTELLLKIKEDVKEI